MNNARMVARQRSETRTIATACRRLPVWILLSFAPCLTPMRLHAQRPIGMPVPFYTTTGLLSADIEFGTLSSSTGQANTPRFAASLLVSASVKKQTKRAWIAGVRATPLGFGNTAPCARRLGEEGCLNGPFNERVGLATGGAFDIRSTILRVMAGPTLFQVEGQGRRVGTTLRLDFAAPRLRGPTPTLFFSRSFLGSQRGQTAHLSTLGVGFRWVQNR